jgi:hypothetical protein
MLYMLQVLFVKLAHLRVVRCYQQGLERSRLSGQLLSEFQAAAHCSYISGLT